MSQVARPHLQHLVLSRNDPTSIQAQSFHTSPAAALQQADLESASIPPRVVHGSSPTAILPSTVHQPGRCHQHHTLRELRSETLPPARGVATRGAGGGGARASDDRAAAAARPHCAAATRRLAGLANEAAPAHRTAPASRSPGGRAWYGGETDCSAGETDSEEGKRPELWKKGNREFYIFIFDSRRLQDRKQKVNQ